VTIERFGPPEVLQPVELAAPVAGEGSVVIDVELANITFVETQLRAGRAPAAMLPELPAVLGNGVGGTVAAAGPGVGPGLVGRRVIASLTGTGGYAQQAVAAAEWLIEVPEALDMADAVALLADGRTAVMLIDLARPQAGETVLVEAAAGGVGSLLVQLARHAGARVVAAAGGERKLAVATELGADTAVDYHAQDWPRRAGPVDVVFDGVGGAIGAAAFALVRPGGRFCPFGMAGGTFAQIDPADAERRRVEVLRAQAPSPPARVALTRRALQAAVAGDLRPVIGQRFPLEQAAAAHAAIESRATIGKTLLTLA
jgi:NADPH2:quinone reductase